MKKSKIITNGNVNLQPLFIKGEVKAEDFLIPTNIDWASVKAFVKKEADEYWSWSLSEAPPMVVFEWAKEEIQRQLSAQKH